MSIISGWDAILFTFSPVFTAPTFEIFCRLATGWLLCTGRRTICGIIPFADPDGERAHDAYHRFFAGASWSLDDLWARLFTLLLGLLPPDAKPTFIMDDTLFHKAGPKVDGAAWWRDAVRSTKKKVVHALGLNLVVVTLRVDPPWGGEPLALPVLVRLHRKGGDGLLDLGEQMICRIKKWLPDRQIRVVADGFYAALAGKLPEGVVLVSRLRKDAAIYDLPPPRKRGQRGRPRTKGKRLPTPPKIAKRVKRWKRVKIVERGATRARLIYAIPVLWYHVAGSAPILLVISRDPYGIEEDDHFLCTDPKAKPADVVEGYANRWPVEDTFRWAKQALGAQQPQSWAPGAPERVAAMGLVLYSLLWHWYLTHACGKVKPRAWPWYEHKPYPSFRDAIAAFRRTMWRERILSKIGLTRRDRKKLDALIYAAEAA